MNRTSRGFSSKLPKLALLIALPAMALVVVWLIWRWMQPPPPFASVVTLGYVESPAQNYYEPFGVAADEDGNVYFSESITGRVYKIAAGSYKTGAQPQVTIIAENLETPSALALDGDGKLIVANTGAHTILRIDPETKSFTRIAGETGVSGDADGKDARFNGPVGVAAGEDGSVFVADTYNDRIRAISPDGQVRTIAGGSEPGFADGAGAEARFDTPCGIAAMKDGSLLVADTGNQQIRRITPQGQVLTIKPATDEAVIDSARLQFGDALFNEPMAVIARDRNSFFVADAGGSIRVVSLSENGEAPPRIKTELPQVSLNRPTGLALLPDGELAFAESGNSLIRALVPAGSKLGSQVDPRSLVLSAERLREMVAPRWPFHPPEARRDIAGTFGEVRGEVLPEHDAWFHNGLDVPGAYGELARAIFTERVTYPLSVEGVATTRERVRLPLFGYIHVKIGRDQNDQLLPNFAGGAVTFRRDEQGQINGVRLRRGTRIKAGDAIGALNRLNHVHLIAGQPGAEFNALAALRLPGISDSIPPVIEAVTIADEQFNTVFDTAAPKKNSNRLTLSGRLRIFVRTYDQADGNAKYRRLGLYRVGYQVLTVAGAPAPSFDETRRNLEFDRLPADWRTVSQIYAEGSQSGYEGATIFKYIATNRLRGGEVREEFFDTSKLPSGDYTLRAIAEDFFGNRTQRDLPITVAKTNQ